MNLEDKISQVERLTTRMQQCVVESDWDGAKIADEDRQKVLHGIFDSADAKKLTEEHVQRLQNVAEQSASLLTNLEAERKKAAQTIQNTHKNQKAVASYAAVSR